MGDNNSYTFIHGIGNQPTPEVLAAGWRSAASIETPARINLAYWVNRKRYPTPLGEMPSSGDHLSYRTRIGLALLKRWHKGHSNTWLDDLQANIFRLLPRKHILQPGLRWLLPDVHDFLFNPKCHDEMLATTITAVISAHPAKRKIIIAHSLGTVLAYEALQSLHIVPPVTLITVGSPLHMGIFERYFGLPIHVPSSVGKWYNFSERLDPVAISGPPLMDDHRFIHYEDVGINVLAPKHPHAVIGYLMSPRLRKIIHSGD